MEHESWKRIVGYGIVICVFSESTITEVVEKLNAVAAENVGMVMIFTIISALQV